MRPELYLANEFSRCQVRPDQLAEHVTATALKIAAELNRRGLEDQLAYLIDDGLSPAEIRALVGLPPGGIPTPEEAERERAAQDAIRLEAIAEERERFWTEDREGW